MVQVDAARGSNICDRRRKRALRVVRIADREGALLEEVFPIVLHADTHAMKMPMLMILVVGAVSVES